MSPVNYARLKTNLQLAVQRLKLLAKKKTEAAQKSRKEIAEYLENGKAERAKIRVEHIIREDYLVEAMEIVEMFCDLLLARFGMITQMKNMDEGLEEAISSLIWVAPRMSTDVKELQVISDLLIQKYGKPFAEAARENSNKSVNEKLMLKLGVQAPPKILVEKYLIAIAKTLGVPYEPDEEILKEDKKFQEDAKAKKDAGTKSEESFPSLIDLVDPDEALKGNPPPYHEADLAAKKNMPPPAIGFINLPSPSHEEIGSFVPHPHPSEDKSISPPPFAPIAPEDDKSSSKQSVINLPDVPKDDISSPPNNPNQGGNTDENNHANNGGVDGGTSSNTNDEIDFQDLLSRFEALKKRKN